MREATNPDSIDTTRRQQLGSINGLEVGRWEAELAPNFMPMYNVPRPCVGPSEQLGSRCDIPFLKGSSYGRATDMSTLQRLRQHNVYAHFAPIRLIIRKGLRHSPSPSEMMVVADDEHSGTELVAQHLLHEITGAERCHHSVERQHEDVIDACCPKQCHLLFSRCQLRRYAVRGKHSTRMAVEGDEQRACIAPPCLVLHLTDEALVTAMHAVEEADRTNSPSHALSYTKCPTISSLSPGSRSMTGISIMV